MVAAFFLWVQIHGTRFFKVIFRLGGGDKYAPILSRVQIYGQRAKMGANLPPTLYYQQLYYSYVTGTIREFIEYFPMVESSVRKRFPSLGDVLKNSNSIVLIRKTHFG